MFPYRKSSEDKIKPKWYLRLAGAKTQFYAEFTCTKNSGGNTSPVKFAFKSHSGTFGRGIKNAATGAGVAIVVVVVLAADTGLALAGAEFQLAELEFVANIIN